MKRLLIIAALLVPVPTMAQDAIATTDPRVVQGPAGPQGLAGPTGSKGDKGDIGNDGPQGVQGIPGNTGLTGPQGNPGVKGDKGDTGNTGATGSTGTNGVDGSPGATGATGTAATVAVGTVTTLSANANPTVANGGTTAAAVLNFGLPRVAVFLTDVTLAQTAGLAIGAGPRTLSVSTNCVVGDRMFMSPSASIPAGYQLGDIFCSANGTAQATIFAPLLAIGGNYSITVKVTAFR